MMTYTTDSAMFFSDQKFVSISYLPIVCCMTGANSLWSWMCGGDGKENGNDKSKKTVDSMKLFSQYKEIFI